MTRGARCPDCHSGTREVRLLTVRDWQACTNPFHEPPAQQPSGRRALPKYLRPMGHGPGAAR